MPSGFESDIFFGGAIQNKAAPGRVLFSHIARSKARNDAEMGIGMQSGRQTA